VRHNFEPLRLSNRVGTRVRLKVGDDDVDSALCGSVAIGEHLKGFSHARRIPQIDL
jgi:hypothetical protein